MVKKIIHLDKEIFEMVKQRKKNFEVRLGNKDINEGDKLIIIQRDEKGTPTKNYIVRKAGHIELTKEMHHWPEEDKNKFGFKIIQLED
jgi:hypothetical protein